MAKTHRIMDPERLSPAERKAFEEGLADIKAGRLIDHQTMSKWLRTWGADPKPLSLDGRGVGVRVMRKPARVMDKPVTVIWDSK